MKKLFYLLSIIAALLGCNAGDKAELKQNHNRIITKYTEFKQIVSKEVNDTFYVYIRLPKNYNKNNGRYPVLYLLDGDISFNMATSILRYLQFGKDVPDLIIAAPGYGTLLNDTEINFRERDYSFSEIKGFSESGGGERYLNFIQNEFIPFVDSNFRTNSNRILNGYSLGGLFSINVLLKKPNLFNNYIIGSPYLINDINFIQQNLVELNFTDPLKNIFISVGELEETDKYHQPIKSIIDILSVKPGINVHFAEFKDGTHFTTPAEALTYGLKFVFRNHYSQEP